MSIELRVSLEINAPIDAVWSVLTDFPSYERWNLFTPVVDTSGQVGDPVRLRVCLAKSSGGRLMTTHLTMQENTPYRLAWGMTGPFVTATRSQSLEALSKNRTRYTSSESFAGLAVPFIMMLYRERLMRGYKWAADGLKSQVEENEG